MAFPSIRVSCEFEDAYIHIPAGPEFTSLHTFRYGHLLSSCNILLCVCSIVPKGFNLFMFELVFGLLGFAGDPLLPLRMVFLFRICSLTRVLWWFSKCFPFFMIASTMFLHMHSRLFNNVGNNLLVLHLCHVFPQDI